MQINTNLFEQSPTMKQFYPDGSGLFQGIYAPIYRARGVTEWSDENENEVNHMA